ncbi:MAG: hypothetical protein O2910_05645, partial [Proteobacteria bacterium]|nr:hypothetical protein [Pseudomonadota bacterium]
MLRASLVFAILIIACVPLNSSAVHAQNHTGAHSGDCASTSGVYVPVVQRFRSYVEQAYNLAGKNARTRMLAYGHALGRLASAVQGQDDRGRDFYCIQSAIDFGFAAGTLTSDDPKTGRRNLTGGAAMEKYVCDSGWMNCRRDSEAPYVYTEIKVTDNGTRTCLCTAEATQKGSVYGTG